MTFRLDEIGANRNRTPNTIALPLDLATHRIVKIIERENRTDIPSELRTVFFLFGASGVGKTWAARAIADTLWGRLKDGKHRFFEVAGNAIGPAEINGLLVALRNGDGEEVARWIRLYCLPPQEGENGYAEECILFFDEATKVDPDVANQVALLWSSRMTTGGYRLPRKCSIICAGNRAGIDRSQDNTLDCYVRRRIMWIEILVDPRATCDYWSARGDVHPDLIGFIRYSPNEIIDIPGDTGPEACPRQWHRCSYTLFALENGEISEEEARWEIAGFVGEKHTDGLFAYLQVKASVPDIDRIIEGKDLVAPLRGEIGLAWNLITALGRRFRGAGNAKDRRKVAKGIARYILEARSTDGYPLDDEWSLSLLRDCYNLDEAAMREGAGPDRWEVLADRLRSAERWEGEILPIGITLGAAAD